MIYTKQTNTIIVQMCRFHQHELPNLTPEQWMDAISDMLKAPMNMHVFINRETGQPRLFVFPNEDKFYKIAKIVDGLVYLTDGYETISENQLIYRFDTTKRRPENKVFYVDNTSKEIKEAIAKIEQAEID